MNKNLTAKLSKTTLKYIKICMDISSALTSEKKLKFGFRFLMASILGWLRLEYRMGTFFC